MRDRLISERIRKTKKSVLLLGPRQVGKSTLVRSLKPDLLIDLADEQKYLDYSKDVSLLRREIQALAKPSLIAIDEVQRVPKLLNVIQAIIDASDLKHKFILTGSSARKLRAKGANLLPGRIILEHLDPLSWLEVKSDFDLERSLRVGMLPGVYFDLVEGPQVLGTYAEVYLREEIRAEGEARDIGNYARFLDVAAIISGQWLNYSKISSDVEIPKETIRRYVKLLEDTLLIFRIPPFQPRTKISRRVSQRDKILFFDVGVRNALLGIHRRGPSKEQVGGVFEQWFTLQLIYLNQALRKEWHISTYRSSGGAEVDVVIERDSDIVGIEIKSGRNVSRSDTRGLDSLEEIIGRYKPLKKWVAYRGPSSQIFDNHAEAHPFMTILERLNEE